jgi:hypothetical protein
MLRRTALICVIVLVAGSAGAEDPPAPAPPHVAMAVVKGKGPIQGAEVFSAAEVTRVALLPQVITTPRQPTPSVTSIAVRAVRNQDHAGFLLEWSDATSDWRTGLDDFGDMVAIAFPVVAGGPPPSPFMGNPGQRVQILQWRADWQTDIERGPISIAELYPNAYPADYYPGEHLPPDAGRAYTGAAGLGNAMSAGKRTSAVQDLMAEGFGSLTPRATQSAVGAGKHDAAGWQVVLTRPLASDGDTSASLAGGTPAQIAFAVWDGSKREVGARKAWAPWIALEVPK